MKENMELGDLDLQLYLAKALPLSQRLKMALALWLNGELRERLTVIQAENQAFQENEMPRLQTKLFKSSPRHFKVTDTRDHFSPPWNLALVGSFALLALCALPFSTDFFSLNTLSEDAFVAKGHGLGVNLFVKGDTAYRVEKQNTSILPTDTLQIIPIGSGSQHIVLLGWDSAQGLVLLFPKEKEKGSRLVSGREPPPALVLQGIEENKLICITSTTPFRVDQIMEIFQRQPFQSFTQAPANRLISGRYVQIFTILKKTRRI